MNLYKKPLGSMMIRLDPDPAKRHEVAELWMHSPVPNYRPANLETINTLTGQDWVPIPKAYCDALYSQWLDFTILVNETRNGFEGTIWTSSENAEHIKKYPVVLVQRFTMDDEKVERLRYFEDDPFPAIRILRPLPSAVTGEGGLICNISETEEDRAITHGYWLHELPGTKAKKTWEAKNDIVRKTIPERLRLRLFVDMHEQLHYAPNQVMNLLFTPETGLSNQEQLELFVTVSQDLSEYNKLVTASNYQNTLNEVRNHMKELAKAYQTHHKRQQEDKTALPYVPNPFKDGKSSQISSIPPVIALMQAETAPSRSWKGQYSAVGKTERKYTITHQTQIAGGSVEISRIIDVPPHLVEQQKEARQKALEKMSADIAKMGDRRAQFHLVQCIHVLMGQRNENGMFYMTARHMLESFGNLRKKNPKDIKDEDYRSGGDRWEDVKIVDEIRESTEGMRIKIDRVQVHRDTIDPKTGKVRRGRAEISNESAVWVYRQYVVHQPVKKDGTLGEKTTIAWEYAEGEWMRAFMEDGMGPMTATILLEVLQFDLYHERWEFRIGSELTFWFRLNAKYSAAKRRHRSIRTILDRVGLLDEINRIDPKRTKDRFEKAMNRLVKEGCLASWKYVEETTLPQRGWLDRWLDWQVMVTEPSIIKKRNKIIETQARIYREATEAEAVVKAQKQKALKENKQV